MLADNGFLTVFYLITLISAAVVIYALVAAVKHQGPDVGGLSRGAWIVIIILTGLMGAVIFLLLRAKAQSQPHQQSYSQPRTPDASMPPFGDVHSGQNQRPAEPPRYGVRIEDHPGAASPQSGPPAGHTTSASATDQPSTSGQARQPQANKPDSQDDDGMAPFGP